jgi:hypothetical protein
MTLSKEPLGLRSWYFVAKQDMRRAKRLTVNNYKQGDDERLKGYMRQICSSYILQNNKTYQQW